MKREQNLAYSIRGKEVAVVNMLSDNVQYWLKESMKVLLKTGEDKNLMKGVYTDKELNPLIGLEMKLQCNYVFKKNNSEHVMEMVISLNELDNTDNLENGRPSNVLFGYHVTNSKNLRASNQPHPSTRNLTMGANFAKSENDKPKW